MYISLYIYILTFPPNKTPDHSQRPAACSSLLLSFKNLISDLLQNKHELPLFRVTCWLWTLSCLWYDVPRPHWHRLMLFRAKANRADCQTCSHSFFLPTEGIFIAFVVCFALLLWFLFFSFAVRHAKGLCTCSQRRQVKKVVTQFSKKNPTLPRPPQAF